MTDIVNNKPHHRYELAVDGHIAATYYKIDAGVITFIHTEVPPELGGEGIGSRLIQGALDQVRADGLKVIAQCPFVKAWIDKHPDYADLLKVYPGSKPRAAMARPRVAPGSRAPCPGRAEAAAPSGNPRSRLACRRAA